MRRIVGLLVAGLFVVSFAACGGGGGGSSKGSFCDQVKDAKAKGDTFSDAFASNDPKKLDAINSLFQSLKSKAPSEIKSDMTLIADAFDKIVKALKKAGSDPEKQQAEIEKLGIDEDAYTKAADNLESYSKKQCGVSLSSDTSDSSSDSSSSSKSSSSKKSSSSSDDFSFDSESFDSYLSSLSSAFSDFSDLTDFSPN